MSQGPDYAHPAFKPAGGIWQVGTPAEGHAGAPFTWGVCLGPHDHLVSSFLEVPSEWNRFEVARHFNRVYWLGHRAAQRQMCLAIGAAPMISN